MPSYPWEVRQAHCPSHAANQLNVRVAVYTDEHWSYQYHVYSTIGRYGRVVQGHILVASYKLCAQPPGVPPMQHKERSLYIPYNCRAYLHINFASH